MIMTMAKLVLCVGVLIFSGVTFSLGFSYATVLAERKYENQRKECQGVLAFTNASVDTAQKALEYAMKYQDTLDLCLTRLQLDKGYPRTESFSTRVTQADRTFAAQHSQPADCCP